MVGQKSPPWFKERKSDITDMGPMPFCELASKTAWEGTEKPRQRTDGASVRQLAALLSLGFSLLFSHE